MFLKYILYLICIVMLICGNSVAEEKADSQKDNQESVVTQSDEELLIEEDLEIVEEEIIPESTPKKEEEEKPAPTPEDKPKPEKKEVKKEEASEVTPEKPDEVEIKEEVTTTDKKDPEEPKVQEKTEPEEIAEEVQEEPDIVAEDEDIIVEDDDEELLITDDSEEELLQDQENIETGKSKESKVADEESTPTQKNDPIVEDQQEIQMIDIPTNTLDDLEEPEVVKDKEEKDSPTEPARIEKTKSIDFAKNLKEYRSPRRAMFLSLLVPGLGQAYARRQWKTAIFGVAEAALLGLSIKQYYEGNQKQEEADNFANEWYSAARFADYYENLNAYVKQQVQEKYNTGGAFTDAQVDSIVSSMVQNDIYFNNVTYYRGALSKGDLETMYANNEFVQGWKDCAPLFDTISPNNLYNLSPVYDGYTYFLYNNPDIHDSLEIKIYLNRYQNSDTTIMQAQGFSAKQQEYLSMTRRANELYDVGKAFIFVMVANHIVSAIDALITARAYNDSLLRKKSVWKHIHLNQQFSLLETGVKTKIGLSVRF